MDLREARFKCRFTQWELARLSKVNQSLISLFENGYKTPRPDEKLKLARALGFRPEDIEWPE